MNRQIGSRNPKVGSRATPYYRSWRGHVI